MSRNRKKRQKKPDNDSRLKKQNGGNRRRGGAELETLSGLGSQIALGFLAALFVVLCLRALDKSMPIRALWYGFAAWVSIGLGSVLFIQERMVSKTAVEPKGPPFSITILTRLVRGGMLYDGPMWFAFASKYGDTISPIQIVTYVRITNLQSIPSLVNRINFAIAVPPDRWVSLTRMDTRSGRVFWAGEGLDKATEWDVSGNGLEHVLTKALQSHETVYGWAFFEIPPEAVGAVDPRLRITVQDTEGSNFVYAEPPGSAPPKSIDSLEAAPAVIKPGIYDISKFHRASYSKFH